MVKDRTKENPNKGEFKNEVFVGVEWFESVSFIEEYDEKKRKIFVKRKLRKTSRSEISSSFELRDKERVIVTQQDNHSLDQALFDEVVDMPQNLIDDNKNNDDQGEPQW